MGCVALGLGLILILTSSGCALALHPVTPPAQVRVKIVVESPQSYGVRLRVSEAHDYRVPADGRVTVDVPAYRPACSTYLFGIKLRNGWDPYTAKTLDLFKGSQTARRLSLKQVYALPLDAEGYHLLKPPAAR